MVNVNMYFLCVVNRIRIILYWIKYYLFRGNFFDWVLFFWELKKEYKDDKLFL